MQGIDWRHHCQCPATVVVDVIDLGAVPDERGNLLKITGASGVRERGKCLVGVAPAKSSRGRVNRKLRSKG